MHNGIDLPKMKVENLGRLARYALERQKKAQNPETGLQDMEQTLITINRYTDHVLEEPEKDQFLGARLIARTTFEALKPQQCWEENHLPHWYDKKAEHELTTPEKIGNCLGALSVIASLEGGLVPGAVHSANAYLLKSELLLKQEGRSGKAFNRTKNDHLIKVGDEGMQRIKKTLKNLN